MTTTKKMSEEKGDLALSSFFSWTAAVVIRHFIDPPRLKHSIAWHCSIPSSRKTYVQAIAKTYRKEKLKCTE